MENERYSLVKIFDNDMWVPKSPVEVLQGALIMDSLIGQNCLQLSLVSTAGSKISSVYVDVFCYGADGNQLFDEPVDIIFRDLQISKGVVFGENDTHYLRSGKVESVKCAVSRVVYSDGKVWRSQEAPVEITAHSFDELDDHLKAVFNEILNDSFYSEINTEYKYLPRQDEHFWVCTCGRANETEASACQRCGMSRAWILQNLNIMHLRRILDGRVEKARQEAEDERQRAAAAKQAEETLTRLQEAEKIEEPSTASLVQPKPEAFSEAIEYHAAPIIEEYEASEEPEKKPVLRYVILGVLSLALVGIGVLIYLLATNKITLGS